ncbi:hypothetical protein AAIR98_001336 [Elusimicrobium simillimum]|uniref:hypothetical protein n=1 Tax=Elusimicrobium simillimum TaxID=3143438 RepID=UPI003C6F65CD
MNDVLLNFAFTVNAEAPLPEASTAFLRNMLAVVKPKAGVTGGSIVRCTTPASIAALTDNKEVEFALKGGLSSVYVLPVASLDIASIIDNTEYGFYTIAVGSEFSSAEVTARDFGAFEGVTAKSFTLEADAKAFAAIDKQCGFLVTEENGAANMFYAFGSLLNAEPWDNRQYITMPKDDGIKDLGTANAHYDDRLSFVLTSAQYGPRLAFFTAGGQAIISPYLIKELSLALQGAAVQYININKPQYTMTQSKLLEEYLQGTLNKYHDMGLLEEGKITITLHKQNYEASALIAVPQPTALWKIIGNLRQEVL